MSHYLPTRIPSYLQRLAVQYARTAPDLHELIVASRFLVIEETSFETWNGGMDGHDVRLYVPIETLGLIDIDTQDDVARRIREDLKKLSQGVEGEFINIVQIEVAEEDDPDCQRAIPFSGRRPVNPDRLSIWKQGLVRVFISHRDRHKKLARDLADELEPYGFSCFVAHETIPANEEWRKVILAGLETMEIMLVVLTSDFSESFWTMQEVGYALGKAVPLVSLKLETADPPGFISHMQALRGSIGQPTDSVTKLVPLLAKALGRQERLQGAIVKSFVSSPHWGETTVRFDRMTEVVDRLTDAELATIIEGFRRNDQLHNAMYLYHRNHHRLLTFLRNATGRLFVVAEDGLTIREDT